MKKLLSILLIIVLVLIASNAYCDIYDQFTVQRFREQSTTPSAPGTGSCKWYFKTDGKPYYRCAGGSETAMFSGKSTDLASATTTNLATATGSYVEITGTTTINSFGTVTAGTVFFVRFVGSLTLTYNATSMILPGARDITTEAGDRAIFVSLGSGNWLCHEFLKANGIAVGILSVATDSATANIPVYLMRGQTHVITGAYTPSMPSAVVGNKARFKASTAAVYSVDVAVGTDVINLNGQALAAGNKLTSDGTINNTIECECNVAGKYDCNSLVGLAFDGGI